MMSAFPHICYSRSPPQASKNRVFGAKAQRLNTLKLKNPVFLYRPQKLSRLRNRYLPFRRQENGCNL